MSATTNQTGAVPPDMTALRMAMHAAGYHPVPVLRYDAKDKHAGKRPTMLSWETVCANADVTEIKRWTTDYKQRECTNTGLLCGNVIGLDIDIPDEGLAKQVLALTDAMLPPTPLVRIGKAPKSLRMFRAEGVHRKIMTPELFLPNEKRVQIEALGEGNHFVSFGIHPDTRKPYTWPGMSPLDIPFTKLPILSDANLRAFLSAAETVMRGAGGRTRPEIEAAARDQANTTRRSLYTSNTTREDVADALNAVRNTHDWAGWHKIGAAIFDALADDGEDLFLAWSAQSAKDDPVATKAKWRSYRTSPTTVKAATLFYEARQKGWRQKSKTSHQSVPPQWDNDPGYYASQDDTVYADPVENAAEYRNGHDKHHQHPNAPNAEEAEPLILSPGAPLESARAFISRHHMMDELRTVHHQNSTFYTWDAGRYAQVEPDEMRAGIYKFLDKASRHKDKKIVPFDPNRSKVLNVLEATAAEAQLPSNLRMPMWLDAVNRPPAHEIVVCRNGLLHLPTRELLDHTPAFFAINALDFAYDPYAPQPEEWLAFLATLWDDDKASISALQEMFGLLLTGETRHQKAFLIVGPKRSGKGTLARILTCMLGQPNVCGPTLSSLGGTFGLAPLIGKRLAVISDARLGGKTDQQVIVERLLAITGEDSLTVDRKFLQGWTGKLDTRFLILSNELPRLGDASGALASRFIIWMLKNSFFGKEDLGLTDRLITELPGILNWALDGWDRLKARGHFIPPPSGAEAQQEMEDLNSPIGAFVREKCTVDAKESVDCDILFNAWVAWCRDNNHDRPGTVQVFGRDLRAAVPGLNARRPRNEDKSRTRIYEGIGLGT